MNKAVPKTIIKELEESQCMFFWSKKWIFQNSLIDSSEAWAITKQVYFRNVRKHRTLAFALPYIVIEIPLEKESRSRILLSYAADITLMIGAMDHFIKVEKGINAWLEKPDKSWNREVITSVCKRITNFDTIAGDITLLRYHEPYHEKLVGKWETLDLASQHKGIK